MHIQKSQGSRRHLVTRLLVTTALVGSSFLIGLATTASAAGPYHLTNPGVQATTDASGAALSPQPVIDIDDSSNTPVSGNTDTIMATITSGGVSVSNDTAVAVDGVATFSGLALNALVGTYTLTFSDTSQTATAFVSSPISVTVGAATQLKYTNPVAGAVTGVALSPQPVVDVEDSGGNIVTSDSSTVTAAYNGAGESVTNNTKAAVNGVATFSGFAITDATDPTTGNLTFSDPENSGLTAPTADPVTVTGAATKLVITQSPSVTVASGAPIPTQPTVSVEDSNNKVVAADTSTVTAALVGGNAGSSITNNTKAAVAGVAAFSGMAINAADGGYDITFTDGSLPAVTTAVETTVTTGAASKLTIVTQPSTSAAAGAALATQPVVDITDSGGNVITGNTTVVTAALTSGSGTIAHNTAIAVAGVATFSGLTLNVPVGTYTLTFTDSGLTNAVSTSITVSAGAAAQLVISVEPSATVASGAALATQPVVKLEDAGGNVITGNSSTVTASVTTGAGTIANNTATVSSTTGLATFSGLTLRELVGSYTLTFTDGSVTTAVSASISVTVGAATQLVITTQPSTTDASGAALAQQPVVKVEDSAGNVVTTDASTVTAKITTGGVSVTPATKVVAGGVATFSGLALNALVGTYTLTFSDGSLTPAVSTSVAVGIGAPSQLVVATEPSASTASGRVLPQQPVIKVEDTGGNIVTTVTTGTVTASISSGAGGLISAGSSANITAGVATFSGLTLTGVPGTLYTLTYSGDSFSVVDAAKIDLEQTQAALVISKVSAVYGRNFAVVVTGGSGTGALTLAVVNGSASGCTLSGSTLKSATPGTCIVTATKANDSAFASQTSAATTITFKKLAIPAAVRLTFTTNSAALSGASRNAIIVLIRKLTVHSVVSITGYAKNNVALARRRAQAAEIYLIQRLHVHVQLHWNTTVNTQNVIIATKSQ